MELQLISTRAKKVRLEDIEVEDNDTSFSYKIGYSEEDKQIFSIEFDMSISDCDEQLKLDCIYEAVFQTKDEVTDEFIQSEFASVNAPAIAFPYFRAFISVLTQQAGYSTIVLPSFNFVKLSKEIIR